MPKCEYENWMFCPDGKHELDPCEYREILRLKNVTISILKCDNCGHISVGWMRQDNTEEVDDGTEEDSDMPNLR